MKIVVIRHPNYQVMLEPYENTSIIHCDCFNWNKTTKLSLLNDLDKLMEIHRMPILAVHNGDTKHLKFLKMCKFSYLSTIKCSDGAIRQIFVRY